MAAAAVVEFQRAQSLISTDRNASIDIFHSIGKVVFKLLYKTFLFTLHTVMFQYLEAKVPRAGAAVLTHCTVCAGVSKHCKLPP